MNIDDLKCCGNCSQFREDEILPSTSPTMCKLRNKAVSGDEVCGEWDFDEITENERLANCI
jgi:hypothetical protein